jgi:hypothetical protein
LPATIRPHATGLPAADPARRLGLCVGGGEVEATHAILEVAMSGEDDATAASGGGARSMKGRRGALAGWPHRAAMVPLGTDPDDGEEGEQ